LGRRYLKHLKSLNYEAIWNVIECSLAILISGWQRNIKSQTKTSSTAVPAAAEEGRKEKKANAGNLQRQNINQKLFKKLVNGHD
jgi:hypothetical protein